MFYGWILLAALSLIYFLSLGSIYYGFSVVIPEVVASMGWSRTEVSAGFSIINLMLGCAPFVADWLIRRRGSRFCIALGGAVAAVGAAVVYLCSSLPLFYLGTAVLGLGMTIQTVLPGTQLLTRWFSRRRALAMGVFMAASGLGGFVAAPSFAWIIAASHNWRLVFVAMALCTLAASLLALVSVKESPEEVGEVPDGRKATQANAAATTVKRSRVHQTQYPWTFREALRTYPFWAIVISGAFVVIGNTIVNSQAMLHLQDQGLSIVLSATVLGLIGLCNTGGRLLSGVLGDRYDPRYLLGAGLLVQLLGIVVLDQTTQPWIAYLFAVLFGIGYGVASVASFPLIANYFGASSYARLFSVRSLVATALGAVGPVAAAMVHETLHSYRPVFLGFAVIALLMVVMAITMRPPLPPTAD